jgi:hypothetical protein
VKPVALAVACTACGRVGFDAVPTDLTSGCALWLKMDEPAWTGAAGEVADACGDPNDGTALGGATTVDDPVRGRVGSFPLGTCVEIAEAAELEASDGLTMSAWLNAAAFDDPHGIVCKRDGFGARPSYTTFVDGGFVTVDIADDSMRTPSNAIVPTGRWVLLTTVFDGNASESARTRVYLDGVLADVLPEADATIVAISAPLHIGCLWNPGPTTESVVGLLDDVAIWTRQLDAFEVAAWYEQTRR